MRQYGKISIILGLIFLLLFLSFLVDLPDLAVDLSWLGRSQQAAISGPYVLGLLLAIILYLGNDSVVHAHPSARSAGLAYTLTFWPLPGLLLLVAVPFLHTFSLPPLWSIGAFVLLILLSVILVAQYKSILLEAQLDRAARWLLNLWTYALAFALYRTLYRLNLPGFYAATAVAGSSGALSLEILRQSPEQVSQTWLYAALVGLIMGEIAWALTFWQLGDLWGELHLFWPFYLLTGLIQQYLGQRLTRRTTIEFFVLGFVGYSVLWYYTP